MKYNPDLHRRRSLRLKGYDYAQAGAYFVTFGVHGRECLFGEIVDGEMQVNSLGRIAAAEWLWSAERRAEIEVGEFVVMPNHFHGIVLIKPPSVGAYGHTPESLALQSHMPQMVPFRSPAKTLGAMIRGFKGAVTKRINEIRETPGVPVWQRNYFEHVIRSDSDYARIADYINDKPQRWIDDVFHPS